MWPLALLLLASPPRTRAPALPLVHEVAALPARLQTAVRTKELACALLKYRGAVLDSMGEAGLWLDKEAELQREALHEQLDRAVDLKGLAARGGAAGESSSLREVPLDEPRTSQLRRSSVELEPTL